MDKTITYIIAILAVVSLVISAFGFVTFQGQISDLETSNTNLESSLIDMHGTLTTIQGEIENYES